MILGSTFKEIAPGKNRTVWQFRCDFCLREYEKIEKACRVKRPTHYCTINCANSAQLKNGILDKVRKDGFQERLGVDYPQQSPSVRKKSIDTCLKRYGVSNVQQDPEIKHRSCETFLKRLEKRQKALGVWSSKSENKFHAFLLTKFADADVIRQRRAPGTRRPIDFFIESIETYIQFDGVYWHGLDRPIEVIAQMKTKHDQEIYERRYRDQEQNDWFEAQGLKLVRVTDIEFDELTPNEIWRKITE